MRSVLRVSLSSRFSLQLSFAHHFGNQRRNFTMSLPKVPNKVLSPASAALEEKLFATSSKIEAEFGNLDDKRDDSFRTIRAVSIANQDILQLVRKGDLSRASTMIEDSKRSMLQVIDGKLNGGSKRDPKTSQIFEKLATMQLMVDFFATGKLSSPNSLSWCSDEEYLAACCAWAQEASRYSLQRAIEGDAPSVEIVRRVLAELHQLFLGFDFRNGYLRRRYDGLKYQLKLVEDVAYELSLLPGALSDGLFSDVSVESASSNGNMEIANPWNYVDGVAFSEIMKRLATFDEKREHLLKEARTIQKLSKQSIFSVMRGQYKDAKDKLSESTTLIDKLMPIVDELPDLRGGAFSDCLEEWCEATMLLDWCEAKRIPDIDEMACKLNAKEYMGGLSDLTGELGRLAVMLAANRQLEGVKEIMEVDSIILDCFMRLNNQGTSFVKKLESVQMNLKKTEDLVFELTNMERSGRLKKRMRLSEDQVTAPSAGSDAT